MQAIIGYAVLAIVIVFAVGVTIRKARTAKSARQMILVPVWLISAIIGPYLTIIVVGGIYWCLLWIGILIREVLIWLIEAVFYPLHWLLP